MQVVVVSSCITVAEISFTAGSCWNPPHWEDVESLNTASVRVQRRDLFGCLLLKCLAKLLVDPPMQLSTKEHSFIPLARNYIDTQSTV